MRGDRPPLTDELADDAYCAALGLVRAYAGGDPAAARIAAQHLSRPELTLAVLVLASMLAQTTDADQLVAEQWMEAAG